MLPRGSGRIIMSSIAAHRGGPDGLTADTICPGVIATGLRESSAEILGVDPEEMSNDYSKGLSQETIDWILPARHEGSLADVAAAAVFLASDGAGYINGESISVDGGMIAV